MDIFDRVRERLSPVAKDMYPFDLAVFAIGDEMLTGYRVAATLSPMIHTKFNLNGWEHSTPIKPYGIDALTGGRIPPEAVFLFPERTLTEPQQQKFMQALCDRGGLKKVVVITTASLILSDVTSEHVMIPNPEDDCWVKAVTWKGLSVL